MSECDICKGCKCPEVRILEKKIDRMEQKHIELITLAYHLIDKMEEKKCL